MWSTYRSLEKRTVDLVEVYVKVARNWDLPSKDVMVIVGEEEAKIRGQFLEMHIPPGEQGRLVRNDIAELVKALDTLRNAALTRGSGDGVGETPSNRAYRAAVSLGVILESTNKRIYANAYPEQ